MANRRAQVRSLYTLAGSAALAVALTTSESASACGGFWCSQTAPVEQTGEQIIFVQNGDGTTTCVVNIAYQGPSEHFAWVLPVEGVPKIDVSAEMAFQRLATQTAPRYTLNTHVEGQCDQPMFVPGVSGAGGAASSLPTGAAGTPTTDIMVLAEGSVGPYDYAVIKPDPALASPADVALDWLKKEGFDVTGVSGEVLGPYLADGLNLVAFRLTKGSMVGSIRPVILTYNGDQPSIPIRPTAVAAQDNMGVLVYVVAAAQAVPKNYLSLVVNEARINWFNAYTSYPQVVSWAADEAGGQGFVTEMAAASDVLTNTIFTASDLATWANLTHQTFADPLDLVWAANNSYRGWDGWRDAIAAAVTLPSGATLDDFGRNPNAYRGMPGFSVNAEVFLDKLDHDVVGPVRNTQKLVLSRPYVTRLYTTMSPTEMTLDPAFTFNPELASISNVHTADLYVECHQGLMQYQAPWRIKLPQGGTVRGAQQGTWPMSSLPANRKIVQLTETGSGDVVQDNTSKILSALVDNGGDVMPPSPTMKPAPTTTAPSGSSSPSSSPPSSSSTPPNEAQPTQGNLPIGGFDPPPTAAGPRASGTNDSGCNLGGAPRPLGAVPVAGALAALAVLVNRRARRR